MIAAPRLTRIAGVFATGLAALVGTSSLASAACTIGASASGTTVNISTSQDPGTVTSVTLSGPGGFSVMGSGLVFTTNSVTVTMPADPVPVISSVTKGFSTNVDHVTGSPSGGELLQINGQNFKPQITATINGGACNGVTSTFTYSDLTSVNIGGTAATIVTIPTPPTDSVITVTTPAGIAGLTNILVNTLQATSTTGTGRFAYIAGGPSINGVGPNEGLATIATAVTVSGTNFISGNWHDGTAVTTVSFPCFGNSSAAPSNVAVTAGQGGGSITLNTPICSQVGGSPGAVNVTVTVAGNTSSASQYLYLGIATPQVSGITPNTGVVASSGNTGTIQGGTPVVVAGSNFVGAVAVWFGPSPGTGVKANGFSVDSAGQISTQTPPQSAAGAYVVSVTVKQGTDAQGHDILATSTATNVTFNYILPAPVINSITPNAGSTAGGTSLTVFGQYFNNASAVTIGGAAATNLAVSADGTSITALTGAHAAGTGLSVQVTTPYGTGTSGSSSGAAALYTYGTPPPTVVSVAPNTGGTAGGLSVTITGTNFENTTGVKFGGTAATGLGTPTCDASHNCTITATTPAHSNGLVDVAVTTSNNGISTTGTGTNLFSYSASPPTVTGISPATGSTTGGTTVTISGTNFTGTPQVTINGVAAAQVTVVNSTTISAVTPAGAGTDVAVKVTTSFGIGTSGTGQGFTYAAPVVPPQAAPILTSISPTSGPSAGKTPVTIKGTNLTGATRVTFGGVDATGVVVVDSQTINAVTPPGTVGPAVDVVVTTPLTSTTTQTGTLPGAYTYVNAAPTVTSVLANTGSTQGGNVVTVSGTNFIQGGTTVTFDGFAATNVSFVSSTTVLVTTPAHPVAGPVNVVATTTFGSGTGTGLFTYVAQAAPTVTAISPASGNTAGGTQVQITGTNFSGATSVSIGGSPATFVVVVSATKITATTSAHTVPGVVDVVVTTPAGVGTGTGLYTYVAGAPTVTAISPVSGPIAGGTAVTITGTNFTGASNITIGGVTPTAVTVVSATSITATTPAHAAGAVDVVVTTPVGTGTGRNLFTYNAPAGAALPTVTAVSPNTGVPGGGTTVTITGTNFTNATAVMFGGTNAAFFTVVSTTSISARSPAGSGTVHVTVTTSIGTSAAGPGDQFSYAKAATSLNLTSSPNPSAIGQPVTFTARITGSNPTGLVTFTENGQTIGTATLVNGVAAFTISTLHAGNNAVTASYPGDANNQQDPETVIQVVSASATDSANLHRMQFAVMPVVTNLSGQAISGAIDNAISAGFGGGCQLISPNGAGFTYCFDGDTPAQSSPTTRESSLTLDGQRLEHDFAALGYASDPPPTIKATPIRSQPRDWLVWVDVRGAEFRSTTIGSDVQGKQINGAAGVTRRLTPDFLVGVLGGYEHFDFTSQAYSGTLKGNGYTTGAYVGWRLASTVRFDASGAWSGFTAADTAGSATGNFSGYRWFGSAGLTGSYAWEATVFEPSARVYILREQEKAYTDSLGALQGSHTFDTGRGSAGVKVSHMFPAGVGMIAPYLGFYGDYYFSRDDATTTPALTAVTPLLKGGAARATGGVAMMFGGGTQLSVGGEYSGLGQNARIWNLQVHGSVSF